MSGELENWLAWETHTHTHTFSVRSIVSRETIFLYPEINPWEFSLERFYWQSLQCKTEGVTKIKQQAQICQRLETFYKDLEVADFYLRHQPSWSLPGLQLGRCVKWALLASSSIHQNLLSIKC